MPNVPTPRPRFYIACEGHEVALPPGRLVMGRGSRCHIVVDDLLASREHAQLTVTATEVVVEDLGSTNGVYVNERRIRSATPVFPGDRIVVGTQELVLEDRAGELPRDSRAMDFKDMAMVLTPNQSSLSSSLMDLDEPGMESPPPARVDKQAATEKADVVATLGRLADRMLTMGRFDAAERVLQAQLDQVLDGARGGRPVAPDVFEAVVDYALRLAEVTRKAQWFDYVIEMHTLEPRLMAGAVVARVSELMTGLSGEVDRERLRGYLEAMRQAREGMPLADRAVCDRLLALELPA